MVESNRGAWIDRDRDRDRAESWGDASDPAGRAGPEAAGPAVELNGTFLELPAGREVSGRRTLQTMPHDVLRPENLELILDETSTLLPFHFLRTGDRLGRAVVKLLRSDGASGSGFLVAPGILLTNHHVLPDRSTAGAAIALANFEAAAPGVVPGRPASVSLDPESLFVSSAELDFTFCGVQGLDFLGSISLGRDSLDIDELETVNIVQHPRGRPKEVALRDNRVVKVEDVVMHYVCSTEPGSSGSPVFNNRWDPVALHHASVTAEGPGGRPVDDPLAGPSARFLNEGIRISAIAIWLEIEEAHPPEDREQVARLRGIFGGIDARIGFFGALGRRSHGKTPPEVVAESYRGDTDDLDLAFWNIRSMELGPREQFSEIVRMVADMGMDLWCLAHADRTFVVMLREHLEMHFGLDYEFFHEPAGDHPALALLYRRSKALTVERKAWDLELPEGATLPPLVMVRAATRRSGTVAFQLVPVGRPSSLDGAPVPYAEAIRHAIQRGHDEIDWVMVGEAPVLFAPEKLQVLADCGRDLLAAAADRDGAVALLTGPRTKVSRVFVSPNLRPAFGVPETLSVTSDRELPPLLRSPGGHQPIALRLTLDAEPRAARSPAVALAVPMTPAFDDLERRVRDMLTPIIAKLLAEARNPPGHHA